jgi:NADPH:quinone reductase
MKALLPAGGPGMVEFGDVEQPRPLASEALVRVEAFSVNRGETFLLEKPPDGWRPGKDIAGLVIRAAADGSGPAAGQRVVGHPPAAGWASCACVPADSPAELPEDVSAVTAITATAQRGSRLAELGAAAVLRSVTDADGPYDLVLESAGGDSFARSLERLAPHGTLIWFGQASREPVTVNFFDLVYGGASSATIRHFAYTGFPETYGADLAVLVRLVADGRLHPEIGRVADWPETASVIADLRERRIRGNAVLTLRGQCPAFRRTVNVGVKPLEAG